MTDNRIQPAVIVRSWAGRVRRSDADAYLDYLRQTGLTDYAATPGNRGYLVLRRDRGGEAEFRLLSLWESMDAIKAFAGDDPEVARYYPEDERFLLEKTPYVEHWQLAASDLP